ncbi:MAG TPA: hypothetical protein VJB92_03700 [Candidatus Paceibacterota bacterium]
MAFIPELQKDFKRLIDSSNLFHAYLFFGDSQEEQIGFAKELANYLENKKWQETEGVLFDARFLSESEIGIDEARDIAHFLWQKPVKSPRRTLVIEQSGGLTAHAQNAILKIAEEPPEHGLLILAAKSPEVLLPPLVSRFQKIYFSSSGETPIKKSEEAEKFAIQLLRAPTPKERTGTIKLILEAADAQKNLLDDIIYVIMRELKKEPAKNWRVIKEFLKRWTLMNQFNVNRKLQLEAALYKHGN